eukprot:658877-Lingulodinium_polyedra.AAC.1
MDNPSRGEWASGAACLSQTRCLAPSLPASPLLSLSLGRCLTLAAPPPPCGRHRYLAVSVSMHACI